MDGANREWSRACARALPPQTLHGVSLRPITPADLGFLQALYATTRTDEMAAAGWPQAQVAQFLAQQFELQHRYYQEHFGDADFLLVLRGGEPLGRLYWREGADTASLIDISLLPQARGSGLGSALMQLIVARAQQRGLAVVLHVEPYNPALRLYGRFGFEVVGHNGVYLKLQRSARVPSAALPESVLS